MSAIEIAPNPLHSHPFESRRSPTPPTFPSLPTEAHSQTLQSQDLSMEGGEETAGTPPPPPEITQQPPALTALISSDGASVVNEAEAVAQELDGRHVENQSHDPVEDQEERANRSDRSSDSGDEEDSEMAREADLIARNRWLPLKEDTSEPCEDELAYIASKPEYSALSHGYWEGQTFFDLNDPQLVPLSDGRIEWMVDGFNGTKQNPNTELIMRSSTVTIGGLDWQIKLYPKGHETEFVSVYVVCTSMTQDNYQETEDFDHLPLPLLAGSPKLKKRRSVAAQVSVVMYNPNEPRVYDFKSDAHQFHKRSPDFGWRYFSSEPRSVFHQRKHGQRQSILRDDKLAFTAYVRIIDDPTGCMWDGGNLSEEHVLAVTGLRPVRGQSASNAATIPLLHFKPFRDLLQRCTAADSAIASLQATLSKILTRRASTGRSRRNATRNSSAHVHDCVEMLQSLKRRLDRCSRNGAGEKLFGTLDTRVARNRLRTKNGQSVQQALNAANDLESPPVLVLELERQEFTKERKWKKLTNRIDMPNEVFVGTASYTLFAFVTHAGNLQSGTYVSYVRPDVSKDLWYAYDGVTVHCLTRKQAIENKCGSDRVDTVDDSQRNRFGDWEDFTATEVAYVLMYVRDDQDTRVPYEEPFDLPATKTDAEKNAPLPAEADGSTKTSLSTHTKPLMRLDAILNDDTAPTLRGDETPVTDGEDIVMSDREGDSQPSNVVGIATSKLTDAAETKTPKTPTLVEIDYFSREYFHGYYLDGKPEGEGVLITIQGDKYEGSFKNGKYHGAGKMTYSKDGSVYEGDWVHGARHGHGKFVQKGREYVGGWKHDKQAGKFTLTGEITDDERSCCQVCYCADINSVFYDCGHAVACKECAARIDNCPVCRRRVLARVEVFGVKLSLE